MNDREVEQRLREELRRRLAGGDPSERLIRHVAHLGEGEMVASAGLSGRARFFRRRSSAIGGLGAAACVAALLAAALFWRPAAGPSPAASGSPAASPPEASAPAASESPAASVLPTSASPLASWDGAPVTVSQYDRLDANFAWVVGSTDGTTDALYVSTDGGSTWDKRPVPYALGTRRTDGFEFVDHDHAFVAVTTGQTAYTVAVMRSSDGGRRWTQSIVLQDRGFDSIEFQMVDNQHGWLLVVDSRVVYWLWRTTDGGVTWTPLVDTANQANAPRRIDFVSDLEGWGLPTNNEGLVRTLDGGKTWTRVSVPTPPGSTDGSTALDWPQGSPPNLTLRGTASYDGGNSTTTSLVTWASADGGSSWRIDKVEAAGSPAVAGGDAQGLYSGGTRVSLVLDSPDGRQVTFTATGLNAFVATGHVLGLTSATAYSETEAWVTIDSCAYPGTMTGGGHFGRTSCPHLLATWDAGMSWHPLLWTFSNAPAPSPTAPAAPPCCTMNPVGERQAAREPLTGWPDRTHGWAVVGTNLFWTADGGKKWDSGSALPASGTIQFLDSQRGWLIATGTSDPTSVVYTRMPVYRTANGGKTWAETDIPWTAADIPNVPDAIATWGGSNWVWGHFADATHGIVARCPHLIAGQIDATCQSYTTDDGGLTFQGPATRTYATAINWLSPSLGHAVGGLATPVLNVTDDGGRTWTSQPLQVPAGATSSFVSLALAPKPGGGWRLLGGYAAASDSFVLARYETAGSGLDGRWSLVWEGPSPAEYLRAARASGDGLVAVSDAHFWSSSDFGQTWQMLAGIPTQVYDFEFVDSATGWQVRSPGYSSSPDALLATTDGGKTWNVVIRVPSAITNP